MSPTQVRRPAAGGAGGRGVEGGGGGGGWPSWAGLGWAMCATALGGWGGDCAPGWVGMLLHPDMELAVFAPTGSPALAHTASPSLKAMPDPGVPVGPW